MAFKLLSGKFSNRFREEGSNFYAGQVRSFRLRELLVATENFSNENILGEGGFGTVYKGKLCSGSVVAIKRLKGINKPVNELQFQREVEMIGIALHRNLLQLLGVCITPKEKLLVYPLMPNGSVTSHFKGRSGSNTLLAWGVRKRIAYGTAKALAYLHDNCHYKIIHRDVKADNVLLDEDLEPIVADFGLAKIMNYGESHVITKVCGTLGHIPHEYFTTLRCSEKTDVYGYGIFLLELIAGCKIFDTVPPSRRGEIPLDWITELQDVKRLELLIDSSLQGNYCLEEVDKLVTVAMLCTRYLPKERPYMPEIVRMLEDHGLANRRARRKPKQIITNWGKVVYYDTQKQYELGDLQNSRQLLIGVGQLGSVYKAAVDEGSSVIIKRLDSDNLRPRIEIEEYLNMIGTFGHPNIPRLLAYYCHLNSMFLVYEYLPHSPLSLILHQNLQGKRRIHLDCGKMFDLLIKVARILAEIHNETSALGIYHGNVKSSSVLIDDTGTVWLSDFGESLLLKQASPKQHETPKKCIGRELPIKTDVYNFGILVLEFITGEDPSKFHTSNDLLRDDYDTYAYCLPRWIEIKQLLYKEEWVENVIDQELLSYEDTERIAAMIHLGLACADPAPEQRPAMGRVVTMIEDIMSEDSEADSFQ